MVTLGRNEAPRPCPPMKFLLSHVEWKACRSIRFDIQSFDRQAYAGMVASIADRPEFTALDFLWSHPKWWTWDEALATVKADVEHYTIPEEALAQFKDMAEQTKFVQGSFVTSHVLLT